MPISGLRRQRATRRGLGIFVVCLTSGSVAGCASRPRSAGIDPGLVATALAVVSDSGRDLTADQQYLQALNRLTFGTRPGDIASIRRLGVDRWIARELSPNEIADPATESFVQGFPAYRESIGELEVHYPPARAGKQELRVGAGAPPPGVATPTSSNDSIAVATAARASRRLVTDVQTLKVARAVMSERQLQEVMVDFWENHFTVYDRKGQQMRYFLAAYDRDAIRPYALGKFRDLLGAVAKSPAMLLYLDNWESVADSAEPTLEPRPNRRTALRRPARGLNENYGRELLELHTLGVDGGYSQHDVIDVARALTGWSIQRPQELGATGGFIFRPRFHDAGPKAILGHALPAGRGIEDGEEVLDILARHPSTARFIAASLCRRFVSDAPPPALVARAAATFSRTNGDIRQVLWTILTSPEFFSRSAYRTKVKSPFELVVSSLRALNAAPDSTPRTSQIVARMGEPIFGHQAPNGYPETGESWMNTGAILNRINFGLAAASSRIPGAALDRWPNARVLISATRVTQVDSVVEDILGGAVSPDTRAILLSGDHPLLAVSQTNPRSPADATTAPADPDGAAPAGSLSMAGASDASVNAPSLENRAPAREGLGQGLRLQGLAQVVGLALGAPEFQRH